MGQSLYFAQVDLLNGEAAPFTGSWVPMARSRDSLYSTYSNGSGSVKLQYESPFFAGEGIEFYDISIASSGYGTPTFSTSPMAHVRAVAEGTGNFWCSITQQN